MAIQRFIMLQHDWTKKKAIAIHHLLGQYHWHTVDDANVLILGGISPHVVGTLENHPDAFLLPSMWSTRPVSVHAATRGRAAHYLSLSKHMGLQDHHRVVDLAEIAYELYGPMFALRA